MEGDSAVFTDSVGHAGFSKPDQSVTHQAGGAPKLEASSAGTWIPVSRASEDLITSLLTSILL